MITETWLKSCSDIALEIEGYHSKSLYRMGTSGGGIKIYYLKSINVTVLDSFTVCSDIYENMVLNANVPGLGDILVCCFYRIPNRPFLQSINFLTSFLQFCRSKRTVICGDFNIDIANQNNLRSTREYCDLMVSYSFLPQINLPTYISLSNYTFMLSLDHAWHNFHVTSQSFVINPLFSDHSPIVILFNVNLLKLELNSVISIRLTLIVSFPTQRKNFIASAHP